MNKIAKIAVINKNNMFLFGSLIEFSQACRGVYSVGSDGSGDKSVLVDWEVVMSLNAAIDPARSTAEVAHTAAKVAGLILCPFVGAITMIMRHRQALEVQELTRKI